MILDQAVRYITELKKQNDTFLLEGGDKVQGEQMSTCHITFAVMHIGFSYSLKGTYHAKCTFLCLLYIKMCPRCVRELTQRQQLKLSLFSSVPKSLKTGYNGADPDLRPI